MFARDIFPHKLQNLQQQEQHPEEAPLAWVGGRSGNGTIRSGIDEEAATFLGAEEALAWVGGKRSNGIICIGVKEQAATLLIVGSGDELSTLSN